MGFMVQPLEEIGGARIFGIPHFIRMISLQTLYNNCVVS